MTSQLDLASYTEGAVVTDPDPDAGGERCAGWHRYAEPCRRCGGSGREPANMPSALIVWTLAAIFYAGLGLGVFALLNWWLA